MFIVYLDDMEVLRETMKDIFEYISAKNDLDIEFTIVEHQEEVFGLPDKNKVDILLLDNRVGRYISSEHLSEFRMAFPNAYICMCSADSKDFMAMGADDQISKPFGIDRVKSLIETWIDDQERIKE